MAARQSDAIPRSFAHVAGHQSISASIVAQKAAVKYARRQYCLHILYKLHKVGNLIWPDEYTTLVKHKIHRP